MNPCRTHLGWVIYSKRTSWESDGFSALFVKKTLIWTVTLRASTSVLLNVKLKYSKHQWMSSLYCCGLCHRTQPGFGLAFTTWWTKMHLQRSMGLQQALALNNMHLAVFIYITFLCKLAIFKNIRKLINLLINHAYSWDLIVNVWQPWCIIQRLYLLTCPCFAWPIGSLTIHLVM